MEKIKSVLSHGQSKEGDAAQGRHDTPTTAEFDRSTTGGLTGQGSHPANQSAQGATEEYHPIYDQFAKTHPAGDSVQTTDHAPHFSNTPNVPQTTSYSAGASSAPSATPSLHTNQYRPGPHEDMSTASIKSGVIGFPQGSQDTHAARPNNNPFEQKHHGSNQPGAGGDLSGTKAGDHASPIEQGAAAGAGALGAGALTEHGSRSQPDDTSYSSAGRPPQINLQRQESDVPPDSGRSFPLAGGIAHQTPQRTTATTTHEREPGTKEREVGLRDGQGREGLAGAAAAAAASSAIPQDDGRTEANLHTRSAEQTTPEHHYGRDAAAAGGLGAAGIGAYEAAKHHQAQTSQPTNPSQSANPEASAAARSAVDEHGWSHDHSGHGHNYEGDPCSTEQVKSPEDSGNGLLFTSGPHSTDTANRTDPKLHIPGEFPSPTPIEESNASSYIQSKPTTETTPTAFAEPGLRHTGTLSDPQARSPEQSAPEHHYGRDAAIAGGLGAAGAGAYAAGKHHEKESADVGSETFPTEPNPYTHTKVDPRVDTVPRGGITEQRYDPTASEHRGSRNAALTGGAIGSSQPSTTQGIPQGGELSNKAYPLAGQEVKSDSQHHYGRDAALVGAGAATTAGLYASQRDAEPDSGPASSTIGPHKSNVANVLDPRVQPNPDLQKHHYAAPTVEDPAPSTVGPHKSDIANVVDPRVLPDPQKQKAAPKGGQSSQLEEEPRKEQHHYGRDAAMAGGAGAAGYGAYEAVKSYSEHPSTQPSASLNDQRYDPSAPGAHDPRSAANTSTSTTAPQDQQHHHGRDAAAIGGVGSAGAGAYAANRDHRLEHQRAVPSGHGLEDQGNDPTVSHQASAPQSQHHYGRDAAVVGGAGALGAGAYSATRGHDNQQTPSAPGNGLDNQRYDPNTSTQQSSAPQNQHHYGRDAAVVGGAGALGAGAYAATRDHSQPQQPSATQGYQQPSTTPAHQQANTSPYHSQPQDATHQRYDSTQTQDPSQKEDHTKRNAALGTGAVAAAGAGAYGLSQHDAQKEQERQLKEQQKAFEEQQKTLEKKQAHDQKAHDKAVAAEEKKHAKEAEHKEKEHAKEVEKKEREHAKEAEKKEKEHSRLVAAEEKKHQQEAEREASPEEEGSPKEKKHRFLTFLNKKDKDRTSSGENSPRGSRDSPRHSKEYATAGAAGGGAAGLAAADHDDGRHLAEKRGRNVLHKEPPVGHPARDADPHVGSVGKREHIGIDGPIGDPNLVSGDQQTKPGVYGAHPAEDVVRGHHTVTEPHTGLPMNVEQYGSGAGGTDGSATVPGHHAGGGTTDWEAIKKGDTVF